MRSLSRASSAAAAVALGLMGLSVGCKPENDPVTPADQSQTNAPKIAGATKIKEAGFKNLALFVEELKSKSDRRETFSATEAIGFTERMLKAWKADLGGIVGEESKANNQEVAAFYTWHSLSRGLFIQPGFPETSSGSGKFRGYIGVFAVNPAIIDTSFLAEIMIGDFKPDPKVEINFYNTTAELSLSPTPFLATSDRVDETNGYIVVVNSSTLKNLYSKIALDTQKDRRFLTEEDRKSLAEKNKFLKNELEKMAIINEASTAVLDQYFQFKGVKDYRRADISFKAAPGLTFTLGSIYEAFSDLLSWQYAKLPLWAHMILLNEQTINGFPPDYKLTISIQLNAINSTTSSDPELSGLMKTTYPNQSEIRNLDLVSILRDHPEVDSRLKRSVLERIKVRVYPFIDRTTEALRR